MGAPECVAVDRRAAGEAIRALKGAGLFMGDYKTVHSGGLVMLPVASAERAMEALESKGIEGRPCRAEFPARRRPRSLAEAGITGISGYSLVGDIAVFSRRLGGPPLDEYRRAAEALVEGMPGVRSVWLKEFTEGEFRVQRLVHLAGERRTWTVHKEFGLEFEVDIARVYFNPRLGEEHRRIAEDVGDGEYVLDMFSGVGGFTVHIASLKRARIVASDINSAAAYYAARNLARNRRRLKGEAAVLWADASQLPQVLRPVFNRIIMNHPTASKFFAWAACALASPEGARVHYYTVTLGCLEAVDEALSSFPQCCEAREEGCREVLDYAPGVGVYRVDLTVKRKL